MLLNVGMVNAQKWKISNDYSISFANKDVSGVFKEMSGSIIFDAADLANSKFNLRIQVESISTGNGIQNKHAISSEWFGASKFPEISFVSEIPMCFIVKPNLECAPSIDQEPPSNTTNENKAKAADNVTNNFFMFLYFLVKQI